MKNTTFTYCLVLLFISLASNMAAQSLPSVLPDSKPSDIVHRYMLSHPNENFVVQTDRDLYFSGTELWFSIWSLDDQTLSPFSYSGIVYIELMDKNGESMVQQTLKLENFRASGKFILPEHLNSGVFYLRVYSNLQRNYGEHLFGIKMVQVINPSSPPVLAHVNNQSKAQISVYPEGQRILSGVTNNLVVKATYPNGLYAGLTDGYLIRQPGDTLAKIDFLIPGLGHCSFFADTSYSYHLDMADNGIIPIEIQDSGLLINIEEEMSQLKLSVLGNDMADIKEYYLLGKSRGVVFFEQDLEEIPKHLILPLSSLPGGLLEFSILDANYKEQSQRLYYHNVSNDSLAADLLFNKLSFQKNENIELKIILPKEKEFQLLSLSIRKDLFIDLSLNMDFKSSIDLHPFLNDWDEFGQISPGISTNYLADIIDTYLIAQSGSRYKWRHMFQNNTDQLDFLPEIDSRHLTGYGYNPVNSVRIRNEYLALFFVDKEASKLNIRTDAAGRFSFEFPVHKNGKSEIVVQAFGKSDGLGITFDWPYHQSSNNFMLDYFHFDSSSIDKYDRDYAYSLLAKTYRKNDPLVAPTDDKLIPFYGIPDSRKYLEDYVSMKNMEEVFKEIVPGEKIRYWQDEYSLQLFHKDKHTLLGDNPLILFNGAPVMNIREMLDLPVSRVDFVDMVRQDYIIQDHVFNGIINVVAKDLNLQLKIPTTTFKTSLEVFPLESRFSKAYENSTASVPDLNPSLYWNPDLDCKGNSNQISIQAGSNPGRYQVLLRGISTDGEILELIKYITIE